MLNENQQIKMITRLYAVIPLLDSLHWLVVNYIIAYHKNKSYTI